MLQLERDNKYVELFYRSVGNIFPEITESNISDYKDKFTFGMIDLSKCNKKFLREVLTIAIGKAIDPTPGNNAYCYHAAIRHLSYESAARQLIIGLSNDCFRLERSISWLNTRARVPTGMVALSSPWDGDKCIEAAGFFLDGQTFARSVVGIYQTLPLQLKEDLVRGYENKMTTRLTSAYYRLIR